MFDMFCKALLRQAGAADLHWRVFRESVGWTPGVLFAYRGEDSFIPRLQLQTTSYHICLGFSPTQTVLREQPGQTKDQKQLRKSHR